MFIIDSTGDLGCMYLGIEWLPQSDSVFLVGEAYMVEEIQVDDLHGVMRVGVPPRASEKHI